MESRGTSDEEPRVGRALMVRDRLVERLRARWFAPVTVMVAPAGYGKSTLLTQAMAANADAPVGVDHLVTCWPGMAAASSLGAELCRVLGATAPGGRRGVDELAGAVVEGMWRLSPQQVVVMLDDVHEVPEGSDGARLLDAVTGGLPTNAHLVLAGRRPPPVRLARLEVEGRVVTLDDAELAFTDAEVDAFADLRGTPSATVTTCGGWPALAELLASAGGAGGPGAGATPPSAASEYVGQEVLSDLAPETRRALGVLAHLGPFDGGLAAEALGPGVDVPALLAGVPLVGTNGDGEWYLHALWQSLVERDLTPADLGDARRRAGHALLRRGRVDAGMRRLIDAGAWDDVTGAVVDILGAVHPPVARDVVAGWYARLPDEVRAHPGGRLIAAVMASESDPAEARRVFEECRAAFEALGDASGEVSALVQTAQLAWWSDDQETLAAAATRVFELEAAGRDDMVPLACLGRALLFDIAHDSRRTLAELDRIPPGSLNEVWLDLVDWLRAIALLDLGHASEAHEAAEHALAHAEMLYAPLAETTRLQALWYQGRAAEVLDALPRLLASIKESGYHNHTALVAGQCALTHALRGRADAAREYLAQAHVAATGIADAPLVEASVSMAEAGVAVLAGDEPAAGAALADHLDRRPLREGLVAATHHRHVALIYVLVPSSRPAWDAADLGPVWAHGRRLARAVVAVRDGRPLPADTPALDDAALVQAHLPPSWVAELALAAVDAGRDDGRRLLEATWSLTRSAVTGLAQRRRHPLQKVARDAVGQFPVRPTRRLELRLLGPVELRDGDGPVQHADWRRERARMLLAYLVLRPTVSRSQAAADLWPRFDPEAQSRNLRVTLTYLLRVLEPQRGPRDPSYFLRQHGNNLSLHADDRLAVDLWDFDAACARAEEADRQGAPATALAHALEAVALWRGEPDEVASEPWAVGPLEERRVRFAAQAVRAGELLLATGDSARAQALAERAVAVDPWLDGAHRLVVAAHHVDGNDLAAHQALRRYRDAIHDLGLDPDDATLMVERLLASLPGDRPARAARSGRTRAG